jgi:predicted SAM-dependent methyltransferase
MVKLHFGSGPRVLKGWINIDIAYQPYEPYLDYYGNEFFPPELRGTIDDFMPLDVTEAPLPFENNSVDLIFHEDFIEHLDQRQSYLFLAETFRIMKPGTIQRVNTPDLMWSQGYYSKSGKGFHGVYQEEWLLWDHKNLFTRNYLKDIATSIGFEVVFQQRDISISNKIPKEFRPGTDRLAIGNIFADLIKPQFSQSNIKNDEIYINTFQTVDSTMKIDNLEHGKQMNCELKLDIACGKNKKPGFTGVDIWEGADIVVDLEKFPWPFEDNSVDEIFCSHYIEHTPDLISFANELFRILKVGAKAEIIAPYYSSIRAWQDPTHLRAISENTFLYFNKGWREINKLDHYPIVSDFDFESTFFITPEWRDKKKDELNFAIKHYINVIRDIRSILTKRKNYGHVVERKMRQADELWEDEKYDEAVEICREIIARGEGNHESYLMVAENACKSGDTKEAVANFRQALLLDGESLQAHVGLIRSLIMAGQNADANSHLDNIRTKDPGLAELIMDIVDM